MGKIIKSKHACDIRTSTFNTKSFHEVSLKYNVSENSKGQEKDRRT